jgi:hypothetical protein
MLGQMMVVSFWQPAATHMPKPHVLQRRFKSQGAAAVHPDHDAFCSQQESWTVPCGCGETIDVENSRDIAFSVPGNQEEFQGFKISTEGSADFAIIKMPQGQLRHFTRALLVLGRSVLA